MKAKRLLAAFMAVAIVATTLVTLSTVSFAATQIIFPELEVTLEPNESYELFEGDVAAYNIVVTLKNYGTLVGSTSTRDLSGTKLAQWQLDLAFEGALVTYADADTAKTDIETIAPNVEGNNIETSTLTLSMGNTAVSTYYPKNVGQTIDAKDTNIVLISIPVTVDAAEFTVKSTGGLVQMGAVGTKGTLTPAEDLTLNNCSYAYGKEATKNGWPFTLEVTEQIVIGEVASDEPVIDALPEGDKTGVAITGQEVAKYDNAYATTASFSNLSGILQAGILFVPKAVIDKVGVTKDQVTATDDKYEVALAYDKEETAIINGTYSVKAALVGIPRALNNVELVTVPYVKGDAGYTYGDASTVQLNFGNTGAKQ